MRIFIICSKAFYEKIPDIKAKLESMGHDIELPNSYYQSTEVENDAWKAGVEAHREFKAKMLKMSAERMGRMDAVLTLNFEKNGKKNYIGGATFLELYEAFMQDKKIFLYNDIPEGMLFDELSGFGPIVINGNLDLVK